MWYVQDPSSDFLRVNSKPNQTHQTLFLLAQQTLLPPEIPIHTLLRLAQSTQTRVVVGVARARAGGEVKETRLESFSPFSYLFSEPPVEKGVKRGVWVWLLFSRFLWIMSGFFGMVNGTLLEASFQEGPCLEGWQGALGGGWRGQGGIGNVDTPGVEVIQQFNRERKQKTRGLLPPCAACRQRIQGNYMFSGRGCPWSCSISLAGSGNCSSRSSLKVWN